MADFGFDLSQRRINLDLSERSSSSTGLTVRSGNKFFDIDLVVPVSARFCSGSCTPGRMGGAGSNVVFCGRSRGVSEVSDNVAINSEFKFE